MSKRSGSVWSAGSRLPVKADTMTIVPFGNGTPRYSRSSSAMRAVNGVIGS